VTAEWGCWHNIAQPLPSCLPIMENHNIHWKLSIAQKICFLKIFYTLRKNCCFKMFSLKVSLENPNDSSWAPVWKPHFGTFIF